MACNKPSAEAPATPVGSAAAAATVNGETISLDDFYQHMGLKQTAQVMSERGPTEMRVLGNFGLQSLQELVDQRVLLQMAKDDGVLPTKADVDAELKFQMELRPQYLSILEEQGLTKEMIQNELLVGIAREHLIMKGVSVGPSEVDKYIKDHPEKFSEPASASLLYIQVPSAARKAIVDTELAGGKPFSTVAADRSEAPHAKDTGGAYPTMAVSQMPKSVQDVVVGTPEKGSSAWIAVGNSFLKFYVVKKTPAHIQAPTASQRELVRRGIALQRGQTKNDFDKRFFEKLRQSKIDVTVPYLKEPWSKTWNQLSQPSNAPSSSR